MAHTPPYRLIYDTDIPRQLQTIDRKYHTLIRSTIEAQLTYEPNIETTNRKPLARLVTFHARWELRFGPHNRFRVYYRTYEDVREIHMLAVGGEAAEQSVYRRRGV